METEKDEWQTWSKHVLIELRRLDADIKNLDSSMRKVSVELAMLKVKASIWGSVSAAFVLFLSKAAEYLPK